MLAALETPPFPHAGEMAALSASLLWTVTAVAGDVAVRRVGSLPVNVLRLVAATIAFCLYGAFIRGHLIPTDASAFNWTWLFISGMVGFGVGDLCLFKAFGIIGSRLAMLLMSLAPPIAAAIGFVALGQKMTAMNWLGMAVTLAGVAWVVLERRGDPAGIHRPHAARGIILGVIGSVGQAVGLVLTKYGMSNQNDPTGKTSYDSVGATQIRVMAGMTVFLAIMAAFRWHRPVLSALRDRKAVGLILFNTLLGTCLGVTAQLLSLRYVDIGVASTLSSIVPVTIIPLAILVNKERVSARAVIGACVTVAGVAMLFLGG